MKSFTKISVWMISALFCATVAFGSEVSIPALKVKPGQSVTVPIMIDKIDNMAGIKLVLKYDKNVLTFKKGEKTKETSPLMHIVNDKTPGILIIVMAGATGIKGEKFPVMTLDFDVSKDVKPEQKMDFEITEVQIMSDKLKNLEYTVKLNPLIVEGKPEIKQAQSDVKSEETKCESEKK